MRLFERTVCQHCSYKKVNHATDKISELGDVLLFFILFQTHFRKLVFIIGDLGINLLLRLSLRLGLYQRASEFDRTKILSRSIVLLDEANKQGIDLAPIVNRRGIYTDYFSARIRNRQHLFESLPIHHRNQAIDFLAIDDKYLVKRLLARHGFPHAAGRAFLSKQSGLAYGIRLGYPLVVKPRHGSQSCHVTMNIADADTLSAAIDMVKKYKHWYLVERYIPGIVHRVTIIGDKLFAAKRLPAAIVGDGQKTVKELIAEKNLHPWRGDRHAFHLSLHFIPCDDLLEERLRGIGYTLASIVPAGTKVKLTDKINLATGADVEEVTGLVHPSNQKIFFQLAQLLNTDILGIDFITADISRPWNDRPSAIIECNSVPSIDMHHFPSIGIPQNAAQEVLRIL